MKLEDIGFYTLEDKRAENVSVKSPLWRCELLLTDRCNFRCPYCRGFKPEYRGDLKTERAINTINMWARDGLKNIRFSGGEPTLHGDLPYLVKYARDCGIKRVALSTNGSRPLSEYINLFLSGVNDFSISFDACCSSTASIMSGGQGESMFYSIKENIKALSKLTYVTLGVVLNERNISELPDIVKTAYEMKVSDVRIITASQSTLIPEINIPEKFLDKFPILRYRVLNYQSSRDVRGIKNSDSHRCNLVLDDMAIAGEYHFPCIIYFREHGDPIGKVGNIHKMRQDRLLWALTHNTYADPICSKNCLDVCVDYNNKVRELNKIPEVQKW